MCGIIGIITNSSAKLKALEQLSKLEYRGYDSAGISVLENGCIKTYKSVGYIDKLKQLVTQNQDNNTTAIAHTRWATHGKATLTNCHPHLSNDSTWAVVHNGIIENYQTLKQNLLKSNIKLKSQTDSEVIPNLISLSHEQSIFSLIDACKQLKGSYALACINKNLNNQMFVAKYNSPLYVAQTTDGVVVSSDIISFSGKATQYYSLDNNEFAHINNNTITFYNIEGEIITKNATLLNSIATNVELLDYNHFMLKEINQTPELIKQVYEFYSNKNQTIDKLHKTLANINDIKFVACGTAYHSGLIGEKFFNKYLHINTSTYVASEFVYDNLNITNKTLCIFISQSGETADTISALKYAKTNGAICVALTNNTNSHLAQLSHYVLPILAGVEVAVASTKAYNCQCMCLYLLALIFSNQDLSKINSQINSLSLSLKNPNEALIIDLAKKVKNYKQVFFIGRGIDYVTSLESSLKLKEITYINSIACQSGELKHGTLALIDKKSLVIVNITVPSLKEKSINALYEIKARGAQVIVLSPFVEIKNMLGSKDIFIDLNNLSQDYAHHLSVSLMQRLSYYVSVFKGINPDKPRNLAKSVTVE